MNMRRTNVKFLAAAAIATALAWSASSALAQDRTAKTPPGAGAAADPNNAATMDLLNQLSPGELEQLVRKADALRLEDERKKAIHEIEASGVYNDPDKQAAQAILEGKGKGTQQDNIDRIVKAFEKADPQFRRACQLFADGKAADCVKAARQMIKEDDAGFNMAAKRWLLARAQSQLCESLKNARDDKAAKEAHFDAIEAYLDIARLMPERISFASAAAIKAGRGYEDVGRFINATKMYTFALRNYSITMTADEREALIEKIDSWQDIFADAASIMKHLSGKMGDVQGRLAGADSGKDTQAREKEIVMLLEDLIKTIEEAPKPPPDPNQPTGSRDPGGRPDDPKPDEPTTGPPSNQRPSDPLRKTVLPGGAPVRPGPLAQRHRSDGNPDWLQLPPTERDKLADSMKRMLSERYQNLIYDYTITLSKAKARGT
jgi:hypothetical protein